jgi:hypothetical protein
LAGERERERERERGREGVLTEGTRPADGSSGTELISVVVADELFMGWNSFEMEVAF